MPDLLMSCHSESSNAPVFEKITNLYLNENDTIVDFTYGRGVFWKTIDKEKYVVIKNDINSLKKGIDIVSDYRNFPLIDNSVTAVVLDPPYMPAQYSGISEDFNDRYGIKRKFGKLKWYARVIQDYYDGIVEAYRLLNKDGFLIVKCQDMVCWHKQCLTHVDIINFAVERGFFCEDIVVFMQAKRRAHPKDKFGQKHARKNHSYFLIFQKVGDE